MLIKGAIAVFLYLTPPLALAQWWEGYEDNGDDEQCVGNPVTLYDRDICTYQTGDILKAMLRPPTHYANRPIPSHLQYAVTLDQAGLMYEARKQGYYVRRVDPEAAVTMSQGYFEDNIQTFDRCAGGGWILWYSMTDNFPSDTTLNFEGQKFFKSLTDHDDTSLCELKFEWNREFTSAIISGYFAEQHNLFSEMIIRLSIDLRPYWKWKFGLFDLEVNSFDNYHGLDLKCCPPKNNNFKCMGPNKLGHGDQCDTVSMACGEVVGENGYECSMWRRHQRILGSEWAGKHAVGVYYGYPIGDKHGQPTGFMSTALGALKGIGVIELFHGI